MNFFSLHANPLTLPVIWKSSCHLCF